MTKAQKWRFELNVFCEDHELKMTFRKESIYVESKTLPRGYLIALLPQIKEIVSESLDECIEHYYGLDNPKPEQKGGEQ